MKFWFGSKTSPAPETVPPNGAAPASASAPESAPAPTVELVTTPAPAPRLGDSNPEPDISKPLEPTNVLIRPQANQKVLYYQLMNGLYDAVMILDDNGHIVDCNNRVTPVLGYARDEMWDMPISDVLKGIGPQIFQQMKDALHSNHQVLINAKCTRKDGSSFQCEVGVCIMHLTRGENLVFTVRNVEKRIESVRAQLLKEMRPAEQAEQGAKPRPMLRVVKHPAPTAAN